MAIDHFGSLHRTFCTSAVAASVSAPFNKSYGLASRITYGSSSAWGSRLRVTLNSIDTIERRLNSAFALGGALCPLWVIGGHSTSPGSMSVKCQKRTFRSA